MDRVRYLEQTDKMSERVRLRMLEEVYSRELLLACVQHSPKRQQKKRWRTERLLQRLRRNVLPERHLRIHRREIKQVYKKYKPKKRDVPPPKPFAPGERFEDFVVIVVRPQGSKQLAEATPLVPI